MTEPVDDKFYDRADAIIQLANEQNHDIGRGKVSASLMYATARFNAWISACGFQSGIKMEAAKQKTIDYFTEQYRAMLKENLEDYIGKLDAYMKKTH